MECSVDGCSLTMLAKGLCRSHYVKRQRDERRERLMALDKTCPVCGSVFHALDPRRFYCSTKCKDKAQNDARQARRVSSRPDRQCPTCGAPIPRDVDGKRVYCSAACQWKANNKRAAAARKAARHAVPRSCLRCGSSISENDGRKSSARYCSTKCRWDAWTPRIVANNRQRLYGVTPEQFDAMFDAQDHLCAICRGDNTTGRGWHLDHDHATGRVRGILCQRCNLMLGNAKDDPALLRAAITYLTT